MKKGDLVMLKNRAAIAVAIPLVALMLSACVSQEDYDKVVKQNEQLQADLMAAQKETAALQAESKWVRAGDAMFPPGGWQLSEEGKKALEDLIPRLRILTNAKIVVYGYTDNNPVGAGLQSQGIMNNMDLSLKRAGAVVAYLASQGVNPDIMSAKGRGETHPIASNDTPEGQAQNRRIEIVITGPGAPGA
jgi:chemotaxis protein MotB